MEWQLKALIWRGLAGMFLIDELHHKLLNKTKSSSRPRYLKTEHCSANDLLTQRTKWKFSVLVWSVCTCCCISLRVQFAKGTDGNGQTPTHTAATGIQTSTSLIGAANWPNSTDGARERKSPRIKPKRSTAPSPQLNMSQFGCNVSDSTHRANRLFFSHRCTPKKVAFGVTDATRNSEEYLSFRFFL